MYRMFSSVTHVINCSFLQIPLASFFTPPPSLTLLLLVRRWICCRCCWGVTCHQSPQRRVRQLFGVYIHVCFLLAADLAGGVGVLSDGHGLDVCQGELCDDGVAVVPQFGRAEASLSIRGHRDVLMHLRDVRVCDQLQEGGGAERRQQGCADHHDLSRDGDGGVGDAKDIGQRKTHHTQHAGRERHESQALQHASKGSFVDKFGLLLGYFSLRTHLCLVSRLCTAQTHAQTASISYRCSDNS